MEAFLLFIRESAFSARIVVTVFAVIAWFYAVFAEPVSGDTSITSANTSLPGVSSGDSSAYGDYGNKPPPVSELDRMVVSAFRRRRLMETAQSLLIVRAEEWIGTGKSIADVLAEHTGVQTRKYGGTGSFQTVSIRGVQGSNVQVLLDGIPLNSAMGGPVDLGKINIGRLKEIEIYKGFIPARFGGNSIGGVINLKSKTAASGKNADLSLSYGGYDTNDHMISAQHSSPDTFDLFGYLSYVKSDNNFKYLDRNNTHYGTIIDPTLDDTIREMQNNQYIGSNLFVRPVWYIHDNLTLLSGLNVSGFTAHIPAPEAKVNRTAYYSEKNVAIDARLSTTLLEDVLFNWGAAYRYREGKNFSTSQDQAARGPHATFTQPDSYAEIGFKHHTLSFPLSLETYVADYLEVNPVLRVDLQDINPTVNTTNGYTGDWHSREATALAATDVSFHMQPIRATVGANMKVIYNQTDGGMDGHLRTVPKTDSMFTVWAVNGMLSVAPSEWLMLFVNGGRFSNQPSLRERYGGQGAHIPNPDLLAETGLSGELGLRVLSETLYAEIIGFYLRSKNTIVINQHPPLMMSVNSEGARVYGIETTLTWKPLAWVELESRATFQHTENLALRYYKRRLPDEPAIDLFETVTITPFKNISFLYGADIKSFYYHDQANTSSRVPRAGSSGDSDNWQVFHNVKLDWEPTDYLSATISLSQVTREYLTDQELAYTGEDNYSSIKYPTNQWCISMRYSF